MNKREWRDELRKELNTQRKERDQMIAARNAIPKEDHKAVLEMDLAIMNCLESMNELRAELWKLEWEGEERITQLKKELKAMREKRKALLIAQDAIPSMEFDTIRESDLAIEACEKKMEVVETELWHTQWGAIE